MKPKQNSIKTKRIKYYNIFLFFGLCLVSCLVSITQVFAEGGGSNSNNNNTVSNTSSANASVTVSAACSFNVTRAAGYDNEKGYTDTLANNASTEITGSTFTTICNDSSGYAIYAIGYGNNTLGETDLISANGSSNITSSSNPASGTSYWQMKLTAATDNQPVLENGYENYSAVPSTYTKVASYSSITDPASSSTRTGQAVTAHYKAYASSTQPADTYTGVVKYTMVHPGTITAPSICPANSICYSPNADGTVNGSMGNQTIANDATSATLLASNFWRSGYGFAGWNTEYDGSGTFYGPNEDIEFEAGQYGGTNGGLSLYAVWVKSTGYLQDWNGCQTLTRTTYDSETGKLVASLSSITALTDKRDNQTYAVARLADGNCWMIENLRLEAAGTVGNNINDPSVTNQSLAQGYGGVFTGLANPETANFSNSTVSNSLYGIEGSGKANIIDTISHTYNDTNYTGYYFPRYRNTNTASPTTNPTTGNTNIYSYGNYYTWAAAIADTTYYGDNNGHTTVATSICPKGWHLPYGNNGSSSPNLGNTSGGFYYLGVQFSATDSNATNSKKWRSFPNNLLYSGNGNQNKINNRGTGGSYWSSSAISGNQTYILALESTKVSPGTINSYKQLGRAVRCIAE